MASLFFKTPVDVDIRLEGEDSRKMVDIKVGKDRKQKAPLYYDGESVKGSVYMRYVCVYNSHLLYTRSR